MIDGLTALKILCVPANFKLQKWRVSLDFSFKTQTSQQQKRITFTCHEFQRRGVLRPSTNGGHHRDHSPQQECNDG